MNLLSSDRLEVILDANVAANQLECFVSYSDKNQSQVARNRKPTLTNNTNPVDISGSPPLKSERLIEGILIHNKDTANATLTVMVNCGICTMTAFRGSLSPGESLIYKDTTSFYVLSNSGSIKTSTSPGVTPIGQAWQAVVLAGDVPNANAVANTLMDVTGLSIPVKANIHYYFKFEIRYSSAIATTGSRWSVSGPVAPSYLSYSSEYTLTATTTTRNATNQLYDTPAAANASSVLVNNLCVMEGMICPSIDGILIARFASEIASSEIRAKKGSVLYWHATI